MKTQTITTKAIWEPAKDKITFIVDGVIKCGFVGKTAFRKFIESATDPSVEVIIKDTTDMDKSALIKQMHAIMAKKGLIDIKADIISQYGVQSSKDLSIEQLNEIIATLNKQETREEIRKERSTVLFLLDKLGVKGSKETGWAHVNNYLSHPRIAGKTLYEMNMEDLKEVQKKLRVIISK